MAHLDQPFSPDRNGSPKHEYSVAGHPPFNVAAKRFNKHDAPPSEGPSYHVAYRDLMQPTKRSTKGWSSMDDAIKPRRGTGAGRVYSSLAPQTAPPAPGSQLQPIYTSYPNETRLQELLDLQRRRLGQGPGPGQYDITGSRPSRTCFRRQAIPQLDGPFLPPREPGYTLVSTRDKEMESTLLLADSGIGPAEYNAHASKDVTMKSTPAPKIGTGKREGRAAHPKSLSVSRSIQHGIDWHIPVLIQVRPADSKDGAGTSGSPPRTQTQQQQQQQGPEWEERDSPGRHRNGDAGAPAAPVGGKPPPPPPAVARSIRAGQHGPGDWDWQRLSHNTRSNWTTQNGGAFSHGDRSTARRDTRQPDSLDYMGPHTESIDPSSLPREALGDIFPIPEGAEGGAFSDINQDILGPTGTSRGSDRPDSVGLDRMLQQQLQQASVPSSASSAMPGTTGPPGGMEGGMGGGAAGQGGMGGQPVLDKLLLTQAQIERREAAMQAAFMVQQAAARRAAWNAKAAGLVA